MAQSDNSADVDTRTKRMLAMAWRRLLAIAVLAPCLSGVAGCVNLAAIQEFADISRQSIHYRPLVTDYVASPLRRARYAPAARCDECDQQAANRAEQKSGLVLMQVTVEAYMDALGGLASNDLVDRPEEYGDLRTAVREANFANEETADSLEAIANVLTRALTDAWRQKKLKKLIAGTNSSLQQVIDDLDAVAQGFDLELRNEQVAAENYYRGLLKRSTDPAGIAAVQEWARVRAKERDERRQAIAAYNSVLTKIAEGHQRLYDNKDDLSSKANLERIRSYAIEIKKAYSALQDLSS